MLEKQKVATEGEWNSAQKEFANYEKELSQVIQKVAEKRRELPWLKVTKDYTFQTPKGPQSLSDLFQGRNQLIMQHFMFAPEWSEGCSGCSVQADSVDGARYHFEPKGVSFVAVGRAPIEKIEAFRKRMGWNFLFVSSGQSEFNYDFHVSFTPEQMATEAYYNHEMRKVDMTDLPGVSVFYKNSAGEIFRTYVSYGGDEQLLPIYGYLDLTPVGRDEKEYFDWIKHHDRY